jgi:alpha-galactosidase
MSLWSIFRSPLMMGGDLPTSDPFTYALLTNAEVLHVDQHSDGGHEAYRDANVIVWTADDPGTGAKYVGVFNVGDAPQRVDLPWSRIGIEGQNPGVRDLWLHKEDGTMRSLIVPLRPHASVLYKVSKGR